MDKKTYAGQVKGTGSQVVEALFPQKKVSGTKAVKGDDLRSGGSDNKKEGEK